MSSTLETAINNGRKFRDQNSQRQQEKIAQDELRDATKRPVLVQFADFLKKVKNAAGSDEMSTITPYGGGLVPEQLIPDLQQVGTIDPTHAHVFQIPMETKSVMVPARVDKDHSNSVAGGFRVYSRTETQSLTSSRGEVEQINLFAESQDAYSYSTEELVEDSPIAAAAFIRAGLRLAFAGWRLDKKINGTGVGQPEGILNTPCKISVTRSTANDLAKADVDAMLGRTWNMQEAMFLAHPNAAEKLAASSQYRGGRWVTTVGLSPEITSYSPPHYAGIPVYYTEFCTADIGTEGDLILFQPTQYLWGVRSEQIDESIHVRFINHERAFRFTCRCDGRMWWRSALTPASGGNTLSPVVVLSTNT